MPNMLNSIVNEIYGNLAIQNTSYHNLKRIEDFFVYNEKFYPINHISVSVEDIRAAISFLLNIEPIVMESDYLKTRIKFISDWRTSSNG